MIALVGERGREVLEFMERDLGEEGMKRSVLVIATSDQPAMLRMKCPMVATTIAEYFKDQEKMYFNDGFFYTFCYGAKRDWFGSRRAACCKGVYPFYLCRIAKLLERAVILKWLITGVYTVLVEGDDTNEPIADTVRGILDGHIVLTRKLANSNHFPAIDVNASISRLMSSIVSPKHKELNSKLRDILSVYDKNADLISIGAYKAGTNDKSGLCYFKN